MESFKTACGMSRDAELTFELAYCDWRVSLHIILYYRLHVEQEHVQTSLLCIEIESLLWKPATKRVCLFSTDSEGWPPEFPGLTTSRAILGFTISRLHSNGPGFSNSAR